MRKAILVLFLAAAAIGITYVVKPRPAIAPEETLVETNPEIKNQPIVLQDYVRYPGKDGKNAFDLLKETVQGNLEFKQYDFGVFVESINGVKPDEKHFWKLYYNGQESQVGADQLKTKNSDLIEWKLEEIEAI